LLIRDPWQYQGLSRQMKQRFRLTTEGWIHPAAGISSRLANGWQLDRCHEDSSDDLLIRGLWQYQGFSLQMKQGFRLTTEGWIHPTAGFTKSSGEWMVAGSLPGRFIRRLVGLRPLAVPGLQSSD